MLKTQSSEIPLNKQEVSPSASDNYISYEWKYNIKGKDRWAIAKKQKENQPLRIVVSVFHSSLHAVNLMCNYHSKQDLRKDLKEGNAVTLQVLQSSSKV